MRSKRTMVAICIVVLCIFGASAVLAEGNQEKGKASAQGKKFTMVTVVKLVHPWFDDTARGIKQAGEELGVNAYMVGPAQADAAQQIAMIEDEIAKGVDAICVVPNDPIAIEPVLKKAQDKGIITITHESAGQKNVDYDVEGFDNAQYGAHIMDLLVKYMGDHGTYVNFLGNLTAPTLNEWVNAEFARQQEKYPNLKRVTDPIVTNENTQTTHDKMLEVIKTYPDINGAIGSSSAEIPGIGLAIDEKGLQNKIIAVGVGIPSMNKELIKSGAVKAITVKRPKDMGYVQVWLMTYLLRGGKVKDGLEIPNLGKIHLKGNTIYPDAATFTDVTAENIDQFNF